MLRSLVVLAALVAAVSSIQERDVPFTARPLPASQVFEPSFTGVARVTPKRIEVVVTRGLVRRTGPSPVDPGSLRAALATGDASTGLSVTDWSSPVPLRMHLDRATDSLRDSLRMVIPRRRGQDLAQSWLLLVVESASDRPGASMGGLGRSYALTTIGILAPASR